MKLLVIILNDLHFLDEILNAFLKLEVKGATLLESEGMLKSVLKSEGLSYFFRDLFAGYNPDGSKDSKTIFSVMKDDAQVDEVVKAVQAILHQSKNESTGFMFTVPVAKVYPLK